MFTACARNYTKPQGRLFAKVSVDCELHIDVPENYTITLYFTALEYHTSTACTEDNMPLKVRAIHWYFVLNKQKTNRRFFSNLFQVYNDRNNELIQSYCGESAPNPLFATTNQLRLKFKKIPLSYIGNSLYDITYLASDKGKNKSLII